MHEMINSIIEAISIALDAEFNPDNSEKYEIHTEEIKQDLKEPCFFIASLNPSSTLFRGSRYFKGNNFVIQYFPETDKKQHECQEVAERMDDCLEFITCIGDSKPIMASNMKHEVVDGVLNYFVNYDLYAVKTKVNETMETMEVNTNVKEGD